MASCRPELGGTVSCRTRAGWDGQRWDGQLRDGNWEGRPTAGWLGGTELGDTAAAGRELGGTASWQELQPRGTASRAAIHTRNSPLRLARLEHLAAEASWAWLVVMIRIQTELFRGRDKRPARAGSKSARAGRAEAEQSARHGRVLNRRGAACHSVGVSGSWIEQVPAPVDRV